MYYLKISLAIVIASLVIICKAQVECDEFWGNAKKPPSNNTVPNQIIDSLFGPKESICKSGGPPVSRFCDNAIFRAVTLHYFLPTTVQATIATLFRDVTQYGANRVTSTRIVTADRAEVNSSLSSVALALVPLSQSNGSGPYPGVSTVDLVPDSVYDDGLYTITAPGAMFVFSDMAYPAFKVQCPDGDFHYAYCRWDPIRASILFPTPDPNFVYTKLSAEFIVTDNASGHKISAVASFFKSLYPALSCPISLDGFPSPKAVLGYITITESGTTTTIDDEYPPTSSPTPTPTKAYPGLPLTMPSPSSTPSAVFHESPPSAVSPLKTTYKILTSNIVVTSTTRENGHVESSPVIPLTTILAGKQPVIVYPSYIKIASSTLRPGEAPAVISGTTIRADTQMLVIGTNTIDLQLPRLTSLPETSELPFSLGRSSLDPSINTVDPVSSQTSSAVMARRLQSGWIMFASIIFTNTATGVMF